MKRKAQAEEMPTVKPDESCEECKGTGYTRVVVVRHQVNYSAVAACPCAYGQWLKAGRAHLFKNHPLLALGGKR